MRSDINGDIRCHVHGSVTIGISIGGIPIDGNGKR